MEAITNSTNFLSEWFKVTEILFTTSRNITLMWQLKSYIQLDEIYERLCWYRISIEGKQIRVFRLKASLEILQLA
jgi:hypothetical protein